MTQRADGMNYAPTGRPEPVVEAGGFPFAVTGLDHGHIYGMVNGLLEAGGTVTAVYDPDPAKMAQFCQAYPQATAAASRAEILDDPTVQLVAAAAIPCDRGPLGCEVLRHGKHYFTDKAPFTTLAQLAEARETVAATGKKYAVYFSERLHVESAVFAGDLIEQGAIGRVLQVIGLGPHRLNAPSRPDWFFKRSQYGGILIDIGSHQLEQFLYYTGAQDAVVQHASVANYDNPDHPELEDFGQIVVAADNGATGYHRVDWFTPDGLCTWGDGRTIVMGTEGFIEMRKYCNVATSQEPDHVFLVNGDGEQHFAVSGQVGYPFFGRLIRDCLDGTETAMTQAHAFKAAELCLQAQEQAVWLASDGGRPAVRMPG